MPVGEDEKGDEGMEKGSNDMVLNVTDTRKPPESRSPTRSASYSPSPPKSPLRASTSRSPDELKRDNGGSQIHSRSPSPRSARARRSWSPDGRASDRREAHSVEVVGLTRVIGESHLKSIFAYYGSVEEIILPTIRMTGENRGRGWIVYETSASARKAQDYMDGGQIDGVVISVRQVQVPEEEQRRESRGYGDNTRHYDAYREGSQRDGIHRNATRGRRGGHAEYRERRNYDDSRGGKRSPPLRRHRSRSASRGP